MYDAFVRDRVLTYLKKNKDYGDSFVDSIRIYGRVAGQVRMLDKVNRINSLLANGKSAVDESVADTLLDLFNYLVMYTCAINDENNLMDILEETYGLAETYSSFAEQVNKALDKTIGFNEENCKAVNSLLWGYIVSFS